MRIKLTTSWVSSEWVGEWRPSLSSETLNLQLSSSLRFEASRTLKNTNVYKYSVHKWGKKRIKSDQWTERDRVKYLRFKGIKSIRLKISSWLVVYDSTQSCWGHSYWLQLPNVGGSCNWFWMQTLNVTLKYNLDFKDNSVMQDTYMDSKWDAAFHCPIQDGSVLVYTTSTAA